MSVVLPTILWFTVGVGASAQEKLRTHAFEGSLQALAIAHDGERYAVAVEPHDNVLVYQREGGRVVARSPRDHGHTRALAFSPDGKTVAFSVMAGDGKKRLYMAVRVVPVDDPKAAFDLKGPCGTVDHLTFSPDGKLLAAGQINGAVFLWDVSAKALVLQSDKQADPTALAFAPNGRSLASASRDRSLLRWDVKSGKILQESAFEAPAFAARYTRDGKHLLVGTIGGEIEEWPAAGDRPKRVIPLREVEEPVDLLALSPDATRAATVYKNTIVVSELPTGKVLARLAHSKGYEITRVAFSEDGAFLLSGAKTVLPDARLHDFRSEVIVWGFAPAKPKKEK